MKWTREHRGVKVPLQYDLRAEPWRVLVACCLLNRAGGHQAKPVLEQFFLRWPTARDVVNDYVLMGFALLKDVEAVVTPCGFQRQRARRIVDLSIDWQQLESERPSHDDVKRLRSVGPYAAGTYSAFCLRRVPLGGVPDTFVQAFFDTDVGKHFLLTGELM